MLGCTTDNFTRAIEHLRLGRKVSELCHLLLGDDNIEMCVKDEYHRVH